MAAVFENGNHVPLNNLFSMYAWLLFRLSLSLVIHSLSFYGLKVKEWTVLGSSLVVMKSVLKFWKRTYLVEGIRFSVSKKSMGYCFWGMSEWFFACLFSLSWLLSSVSKERGRCMISK